MASPLYIYKIAAQFYMVELLRNSTCGGARFYAQILNKEIWQGKESQNERPDKYIMEWSAM